MNAQAMAENGSAVEAEAPVRPALLFVSRKWAPAIGGMETYSLKLCDELEHHADVERVVLPGKSGGGAPGMAAIVGFGIRAAGSILFRRRAPDIVHIADMASWPLAVVARLRSRRSRVVLSAHGSDVSFPDRTGILPKLYGIYMTLGATLIGGCKVLANSNATADRARAHGFRAIEVIPLATDMESALESRVSRKGERVLLFAGRLVPSKGCGWFIENVLPALPDDVHLEVAGTVWDAGEERALDAPRVDFLGPLDPGALRQAYADADCVIVPNISTSSGGFEGFGLVAAEASAAGGLVLAAAHTGLEDAVIDGETGLKLPSGDAEAWVQAVSDVLDWPDARRAAFLRTSVERAGRYFSWTRVARGTFDAYGWTR